MTAQAFIARGWEDLEKFPAPASMRACRACMVDLPAPSLDFRALLDAAVTIDGVPYRCRAVRHAGAPSRQCVLIVERIADVQPAG